MPQYEYSTEVAGHWDGLVTAKNKKEADKKAREEVNTEGLTPVGKMFIDRVPKDQEVNP
tara:strand:- start:982 stop:1158 length:177 start_codon:yes stop_codon:yes gene_type:complete